MAQTTENSTFARLIGPPPPLGVPRFGALRPPLVLAICCMSLFIVGMDNTIVNVALPSVAHHFHAGVTELQWVVDAYLLVLASLLVFSGSTSDRFGRAKIFKLGLTIFLIGSLLCGFAQSVGMLIACRALQAIGGSMLNPVALSIIREVFTDPRKRAQAIGVWGGVIGISFGIGPVLGGFLVEAESWRLVFYVNVPIALLAMLLTFLFVPESKAKSPRRFDPVGQVLVFLGLTGVTFGLIEGERLGWDSAAIIGAFLVAILALTLLVPYENRREQPLLELSVFKRPAFSAATSTAVMAFASFAGFLFLMTLYLQDTRHLSPIHAGLFLLPNAAATMIAGPLSGRLISRRGPEIALVIGGVSMTVAALMLTAIDRHTSYVWILCANGVFGWGSGFLNPPITNTAVSGLPAAQAGVAAALASTSRQVGSVLGVAVVGAVMVGAGTSPGLDATGWWVITIAAMAVLVISFLARVAERRIAAG